MASMLSIDEVEALLAALDAPANDSEMHLLSEHSPGLSTNTPCSPSLMRRTRRPKRTRSSTPTRDQEQAELRALRSIQANLTTRLHELRAAIRSAGGVRGRQAVLRFLARKKLLERRDAERRNQQLRTEMATQYRLSCELMARISAQSSTNLHGPHYLANEEDQATFAKLALELDVVYGMLSKVFPDERCSASPERDSRFADELELLGSRLADEGVVQTPGAELRNDCELPFDFYNVIDATWRSMTAWHAGANGAATGWATSRSFPGIERPEHTFGVMVRLQWLLQVNVPTYYNEKVVVRRYIEPDRFVVVWVGSYDGELELLGSQTLEIGWIVVDRVRRDGSSMLSNGARRTERPIQQDVARMRLYARLLPTGRISSARDCEATLASRAIKSCEEDLSFIYRNTGLLLAREWRPISQHLIGR